ncbi:unnamed protein product [Ilex paraguariensis]|uniref:Uncharacterized protein n=1 Tax=Ilex paraguariensis TaxID=185542 RepID=A0ABC8UX59_9AQUA
MVVELKPGNAAERRAVGSPERVANVLNGCATVVAGGVADCVLVIVVAITGRKSDEDEDDGGDGVVEKGRE